MSKRSFEFAQLRMRRELWDAMREDAIAGVDTLERRRERAAFANDELAGRYPAEFARWRREDDADLERCNPAAFDRECQRRRERSRRLAAAGRMVAPQLP
jgi:hypothetical protein